MYKILSKQGLYNKKACFFSDINNDQSTVPPYQRNYPEITQITEKDRILGQNPIKAGLIQEKSVYLSDINNAQSTVPPYQIHNYEFISIAEIDQILGQNPIKTGTIQKNLVSFRY